MAGRTPARVTSGRTAGGRTPAPAGERGTTPTHQRGPDGLSTDPGAVHYDAGTRTRTFPTGGEEKSS
eukprot:507123-Pyramimonas_sp.AAC.1